MMLHFDSLQEIYRDVSEDHALHYLGRRPQRLWNADAQFRFNGQSIEHTVCTEEAAVHPGWLREIIVNAIKSNPGITTFLQHEIIDVAKVNATFRISAKNLKETEKYTADIVVNCLWEGRQRVDSSVGLEYSGEWITRVKYGFILDATPQLQAVPSLILVHGPFGDIVKYPWDNSIYITWYPSCMAYLSNTHELPPEWDAVCNGTHPRGLQQRMLYETKSALSEYLPELQNLRLRQVMAGAIIGQGKTDISDRESGLHNRHGIGVAEHDNYYSIFTGKFTSAPANAMQLQKMLT